MDDGKHTGPMADGLASKWYEFLAPRQGAVGNANGFRGCRGAQSPANVWHRFAVAGQVQLRRIQMNLKHF
jgi:hypothetical protein